MKLHPTAAIVDHFASIPDPRLNRRKRHKLSDIFFITLCAVICGADDWASIELFGKSKRKWFTEVLGLQHGIPSHDTFGRVFGLIDTQQFSECFSRWVADLSDLSDGEIIAIDGKCLRRSLDSASDKAAIYMVSAWATRNQLVLGQQRVDDKSNEITAIPKLLMQLNMTGAVVTLDAMGCQTAIARQIIDQQADYLLSLKGNQGTLHQDVKLFFESANTCPPIGHTRYDGGHGRIETRIVRATSNIGWLKKDHPHWTKLTSIIAVTAIRECKDKTTEETRYFISSMDASNPERLGQVVRAHWGIENNLHWVLDYAFREDDQRMRSGNSDANMAVVRHIALNLVKTDKTIKVGVKNKRLNAGWDEDYLLKIVTGRLGATKIKI
ncbi:ISAs1 family transposase [Thiothrix nivea]|uniref:Transposase IS4 family protein n=1 Tax=Thiothrix nivea (strain ATCC 35100 / DSM 5205 / JP2) TaxID=870187 RepID=A0A656HBF7_THINJ|nr:ISAs1 family transposase [Thiothrix nivea]EIJ34158.1 transposase IS4 family protein [Thiothrix nivea DSM 5205]EIJ34239.1 transposase IS4 family protein [Thiothrix nivea DSM 5205]EIJ35017.1 transposase IS4 family protein [Thiothrix nivea DSM 5205]EIJ36437.1 transposase IS4 family protein [Thiothrix nivea DSM 5205]